MPDWLIQALVSQVVWETLSILGVGVFLAYLRRKAPEYASAAVYGIVGASCVVFLFYALTGRGLLSRKPPAAVTPENLEENLKVWADDLAMGIQRQEPSSDQYFSYVARVVNADPVEVYRARQKPGYLQFRATLTTSPIHRALLSKLSPRDRGRFLNVVDMEVSRFRGITSNFLFQKNPMGSELDITFGKAIPIEGVNEGIFVQGLDDTIGAVSQARATINLALDRYPVPESVPR